MPATIFSKTRGRIWRSICLHAAGFDLEDADGIAPPHHFEGVVKQGALLIVGRLFMSIRNAVDRVVDATVTGDEFTGFAHNRQG